ncbi:GNAT family N-acetyltransferase [Pluralibacter gergoviae]|uniref:GNAT family N-acetyltransferase n=1 Tax=Pluralibacter gergoviae TaxID=61647 RepID=A0AAW8HUL2_PLUGE|nr:GNAT family N-acetyltransferase [Pluralibacter gergoviae]AVR04251.1 N-acetyltransferase [Pluralibacter gergoviae]EKV6246345.1 GNAT family N-acetyltransferase [Pluralibacter gergoviae]EKW9967608.1 GNAT family N-acetyltransferase [Pluralibacter gergoviae]ELC3075682.1 GNAT family N-acetyltransferase [Pluralibacter gergoviae]ELO7480405.1 GNAT family N-acetyltransferase [Pluralibacter gergoviae]
MQIRNGRTSDFSRLERCDFSFTVNRVARGPFIDGDLQIEAVDEPWLKIYELDIQTLENHCADPQGLFLVAETAAGEIAGFITASQSWNQFITIDYIAIDSGKRRSGAARLLMDEAHRWACTTEAAGLRLETQNVNVSACLFYRSCGFSLGGYDRYLYNALPEKEEVALFWYYMLDRRPAMSHPEQR